MTTLKNKTLNKLNYSINERLYLLEKGMLKIDFEFWLKNKNKIIAEVDKYLNSTIDDKLSKRIERYINYIKLLEKETDINKKEGYVFNFIVEIPEQLKSYIANKIQN